MPFFDSHPGVLQAGFLARRAGMAQRTSNCKPLVLRRAVPSFVAVRATPLELASVFTQQTGSRGGSKTNERYFEICHLMQNLYLSLKRWDIE